MDSLKFPVPSSQVKNHCFTVIIQYPVEVISLWNTKSEDESEKHRKQYNEWGSKVHSELIGI